MGTAERRFNVMKILCRRRYETMPNLAEEFGVSIRTMQRDIDHISNIMPIYVKAGRYEGGVYVVDEFHMDRAYMSVNELALLEKVKEGYLRGEKYPLCEKEIQTFSEIIRNYTKPTVNKRSKSDSNRSKTMEN